MLLCCCGCISNYRTHHCERLWPTSWSHSRGSFLGVKICQMAGKHRLIHINVDLDIEIVICVGNGSKRETLTRPDVERVRESWVKPSEVQRK